MLQNTNFYLQYYPCKSLRDWFDELIIKLTPQVDKKKVVYHQNNQKHIIFCPQSISNHFFPTTIFNRNLFLNFMTIDNFTYSITQVQKYLEFYCEKTLLNGVSGESEIYVEFSDDKKYLLRKYKDIKYDNFDINWMNRLNIEHGFYTKLSNYFLNTPFSYIWAMNFIDNKEDVLLFDDDIVNSYPILRKYMNFITETTPSEQKYKLILLNAKKENINMPQLFNKLDKGGLLISRNINFDLSPNTVGWHDIRSNITAFFKK